MIGDKECLGLGGGGHMQVRDRNKNNLKKICIKSNTTAYSCQSGKINLRFNTNETQWSS